jgi:hypothetical protein
MSLWLVLVDTGLCYLQLVEIHGEGEGLDQLYICKVGCVDGAVGSGVNVVMTGERNQQLIAHGQPLEI